MFSNNIDKNAMLCLRYVIYWEQIITHLLGENSTWNVALVPLCSWHIGVFSHPGTVTLTTFPFLDPVGKERNEIVIATQVYKRTLNQAYQFYIKVLEKYKFIVYHITS